MLPIIMEKTDLSGRWIRTASGFSTVRNVRLVLRLLLKAPKGIMEVTKKEEPGGPSFFVTNGTGKGPEGLP
jgi:hypothetical protein